MIQLLPVTETIFRMVARSVFMIAATFPVAATATENEPTDREPVAHPVAKQVATDGDPIRVHDVRSRFVRGPCQIRVLVPDNISSGDRLPVVFVLPVEAGRESRYGDGMTEILRADLHNHHRAVFVSPTFPRLPWYADHPTDPKLRQESHLLKFVVPWVGQHYPVSDARYLLGFSKSGWGAWTLLLRHSDTFRRAAAWDAPMMMDRVGRYGSGPIFGNQEQFDAYRVTTLLRSNAEEFTARPRLILTGFDNFREHHQRVHSLLDELGIPHQYRDGPQRDHRWDSGWIVEAAELLMNDNR
ncbi:hypothetical protein FYK55_02035 [Roseiconus nitratireducens]|uniref:Esterase n=1 Tax=Roseiconus nitratireducens TaxID=2605748 RepID=A0A5M6DLC9_9BACT|nr:hypothetical protein [Roseiconus nitratireducens]KAA5547206.1 hypothetical protein FYK55_02035 [Roseiconus nitratireducens]